MAPGAPGTTSPTTVRAHPQPPGRDSLRCVVADVETRPVGSDDLADLAVVFDSQRTTRHCWCMAFCATRTQFAAGWFGGGNRRRFKAMTLTGTTPMGILASVADKPVGWCACGPRSRYVPATSPRNPVLAGRPRDEDESVWLLPCLFVRDGHRGQGVTYALILAAVDLARREGAVAIEGWPVAGSDRTSADAFLGREKAFEDLGFSCVDRPGPDRVVMRRDLRG